MANKAATAKQSRRMQQVKVMGCLACRLDGRGVVFCEAHHLNEGGVHGGRRRGHEQTIGLCAWHHRGVSRQGWSIEEMTAAYGPSWAHQPTAFSIHYGDDDRLLAYQEELLRAAVW